MNYVVCISLFCLFGTSLIGCGKEEPLDPRVKHIYSATSMTFDSGGPTEYIYVGEDLRDFLEKFELDTFKYGPRNVRVVNDCRGGTIMINQKSYLFSLCTLESRGRRAILSVGMGGKVVRMVWKRGGG